MKLLGMKMQKWVKVIEKYVIELFLWQCKLLYTCKIHWRKCCLFVFFTHIKNLWRLFCYITNRIKYSRMDQVKFFKGCLPQILLCPILNTLSHMLRHTFFIISSQKHHHHIKTSYCGQCFQFFVYIQIISENTTVL